MSVRQTRRYAPATRRNRVPILEVLRQELPAVGTILETGSGTGEHAVYFARALKPRIYLPSEPNPELRASIEGWCMDSSSANLRMPLDLDVTDSEWPVEGEPKPVPAISAILTINMIHIASWRICLGILAGAGRILGEGGVLYFYGPFKQENVSFGSSNEAFDLSLRSENPNWGVRSLEEVTDAAVKEGLSLRKTVHMPAGNLSVIYERLY